MHVITLLNTIKIFRPTNAGGNRGRIQSRCYFNWCFHERQRINAISQGKKEEKLTESALLYGKAKWRLFNTVTTPCDDFAAVSTFDDVMPPADRCSICSLYFWWFRRDSLGGRYRQKIQGCQIDQQIQRWFKDQLQDSIANKGMGCENVNVFLNVFLKCKLFS